MHDRVLIAGTNSGCGKTTVTMAVLSALRRRGVKVGAFKCGPDYIDPMFHRQTLGIPAYNLDPFFLEGEGLTQTLSRYAPELSVIEGVMGFFDGIGTDGDCSTYDVAVRTETPVILVISAKGMYTSAGAMLKGFQTFREKNPIKGVIFNGVNGMLYAGLKEIAVKAGVKPLGYFPKDEAAEIGSRHLGLITADEITDLKQRIDHLGEVAEKSLDIDGILQLAAEVAPLPPAKTYERAERVVRIAVAKDEAFCFLYQENLDLLEALGCEIVPFSPLKDEKLPEHISGLYIPGGYPELHTKALSANKVMLQSIKKAVDAGLPTIAECGGFMYLHESIDGVPMVGVIPGNCFKTSRLQRFGYATLMGKKETMLCGAGDAIRVHEFHYYDSEHNGDDFEIEKASNKSHYFACHGSDSFYAGYPHLYFPANAKFAENFVKKAVSYGNQ